MAEIDYLLIDPKEVPGLYESRKIEGVLRDPDGRRKLLEELDAPSFGEAAWELEGTGEGKLSTPYKAALQLEPEFGRYEAQTTGDCVAHGCRNAGMLDYCVDVLRGETEYKGRLATEPTYGSRGHGGQGMSCSVAARFVWKQGKAGFFIRKRYEGPNGQSVDLSKYNSRIGSAWGRRGVPDWLCEVGKEHPAETVALITTVEEARDALANGYGINVCSGWGFSSQRDENGFARPKGSWSHAMAWIGCDDRKPSVDKFSGTSFLIQNSWGNWNRGPKREGQPDGSFWITESTAARMLRGRGAWVISRVVGFPRRDLDYILV